MRRSTMVRVVGLHKLPFDEARYEEDVGCGMPDAPREQAAWRRQVREAWVNAWIVIVECTGSELDFSLFAHPAPGPHAQAAYEEKVLAQRSGFQCAAFFLHYVDPTAPLWYGDQPLALPIPTGATPELVAQMPYTAPT